VSYSSPVSHPTNGAGQSVFERGLFSRVNTPRQHWLASGLLPSCYIGVSVEVASAAVLLGGERFNVL
jgi:hypothetical protein